MKVLLVNITGQRGSTGKIVTDIKEYLESLGNRAIIAYGHSDNVNSVDYIKVSNTLEARITSQLCKFGRPVYKGNPLSLRRLKRLIKKEQPDIINLHCINGFDFDIYTLCNYLANFQANGQAIPVVITHHAEFLYTGSCSYAFECDSFSKQECRKCYNPNSAAFSRLFSNPHKNWVRMYKAINGFKKGKLKFVSVSPWVHSRAIISPIVNNYPDITILNGVNTDIFHYRESPIRKQELINGNSQEHPKGIILHVTSHFSNAPQDIKGGKYILEIADSMPDYLFIIISPNKPTGLHISQNIIFYGYCENQIELAEMYSIADATLLTSKRETFSMVVAESLCCGTPVVGFLAGGPESIALKEYSSFAEYGRTQDLINHISQLIQISFDKNTIATNAQKVYAKERMGAEYLKLYEEMIHR